ncbi:hypothetical protein LCGC14_2740440 [marine sediment metagenome]|uniref:Uncharacterized protein n=1 Tax=marine sediment metagenome TaxID=412755 RepID=A0A0F8ZRQ8_9ZZZZ
MSKYCSYCGDEIEDAEDMYEIMDRNGLIARLCRFCWVVEKPFLPGEESSEWFEPVLEGRELNDYE